MSGAGNTMGAPGRRLKVLVVVIDMAGGTGTFCRLFAAGMKKYHGPEFATGLMLIRDAGLNEGDRALFDGVEVVGGNVHTDWRRWVETPLHARRLGRAVRRSDADLIFTVGAYANLLAPRGARGRPVVLSVHVHATRQLADTRFGGVTRRLMRRLYGRYPVVTPASDVTADLKENFDVPRATTIPHGIDAEEVRARGEAAVAELPVRGAYIAACGRLAAQKDYPTLIRAYALARGMGLAEELVIIGEGEERSALQGLIDSLGLAGHAHLIGHRANPFPCMAGARLFVLSSKWEGFGLVLLEAMALGVPCVSTDCPSGPGEILGGGKSGVLVPVGDARTMAAAIVRVLRSEDERGALSENARERAGELSLGRMAGAYREVFLQEIARARRQSNGIPAGQD